MSGQSPCSSTSGLAYVHRPDGRVLARLSNRAYTIVDTEPAVRTGTPITYTPGGSPRRASVAGEAVRLCRYSAVHRSPDARVSTRVSSSGARAVPAAVPGNAVVPAGAADPWTPNARYRSQTTVWTSYIAALLV